MKTRYATTLWTYLNEIGVWQPGDPVRLGDYGYRESGCFKRVGHIEELIEPIDIEISYAQLDDLIILSKGTRSAGVSGHGVGMGRLSLSGSADHNVLLQATRIEVQTVIDLRLVEAALLKTKKWRRSYCLVTSIRTAGAFDVMISGSGGKAIELQADADALGGIAGGVPSLTGSVDAELSDGIRFRGTDGPISVGVHRQAFLGRSFKNAIDRSERDDTSRLVPVIDEVVDDVMDADEV